MITIVNAAPADLPEIIELLFQHVPEEERLARLTQAMSMVAQGELRAEHILVARAGQGKPCAAMIYQPLPGACGLLWPPQAGPGAQRPEIEDQLVQAGLTRLRRGGAKLAQAILDPAEAVLAGALQRNGFRHITQIEYLRHSLANLQLPASPPRIRWQTEDEENRHLLPPVLELPYQVSLDCPELNGIRSMAEVIAGHRGQGVYRPDFWWLAFLDSQPVGVLLLSEIPAGQGLDLAYVGVVPEARRRGVGRALLQLALQTARQAQAPQLTLALDVRNLPARKLYEELGFELTGLREVYLCFLTPHLGS